MSLTSPQKRKGSRWETSFCKLIGGSKVPLSGALPGLPGDVIGPDGMVWECKSRKDGFKQYYKWLENKDALAIKADYKEPLVVMRLGTYLAKIKS